MCKIAIHTFSQNFELISLICYILAHIGDIFKMTIRKFLYTHSIFRFDEFKDWKLKQGSLKAASLHSSINYYISKGILKRLRRELFSVIPPNETSDTVSFDPYLIAGKVTSDCVLAYHTALELHGVAYSSFEQFTFLTSQKVKPFEIDGQWFQPVLIPNNAAIANIGIQDINRQGMTIKITNLSRTYVDIIDRPDLCGGWEEVCRSINSIATLNTEELLNYCLTKNNSTLIAKIGYFLEQREGVFSVSNDILEQLQKRRPLSTQYMGDRKKEKHKFIKKWNLMVPISVLQQSWDEPNYDV